MSFLKNIFLMSLIPLGAWPAQDLKLTCPQLEEALAISMDPKTRAYCDTAQEKCRLLGVIKEMDSQKIARKRLEAPLSADTAYNLGLCEVAIEAFSPEVGSQLGF
jgi:hypothetical protein